MGECSVVVVAVQPRSQQSGEGRRGAFAGTPSHTAASLTTKSGKREYRIAGAKQSHSLCPYCAVGCSLVAYTKTGADGRPKIVQIEGEPDSPVNEGRLCPKGAAAMQLATNDLAEAFARLADGAGTDLNHEVDAALREWLVRRTTGD